MAARRTYEAPMPEGQRRGDSHLYLRLLRMARPYWLHVTGVLVLSLLGTPLALLQPVPVKLVVDSVLGSSPVPAYIAWLVPDRAESAKTLVLLAAVLLLVMVTLLSYLEGLTSWILQTYTGEKLVLGFRALLFRHAQRLSLAYHDTKGTTDSTYRIQYDAFSIYNFTIGGAIPLISAAFTLIGMVCVTALLDWQLSLVALSVCPVLYFLVQFFGRRIRSRWKEIRRLESSTMTVIQEVLSSVRIVKAFGREDREEGRFLAQSDERLKGQVKVAFVQGAFDLLVGLTIAAGTATVLFLGVHHVQSGLLTLGELLMVMSYLSQIYAPLKTISKKLADLQSGLASAERAFTLLDQTPEVIERPHALPLVKARGEIEFQKVCFSYEADHPVLNNISFHVPPGSKVGLQGRTGAGKTTLISLLMRFYDPTAGRLLLDGVDLREFRLADLRKQFALMLQEPILFSTTIAENIAYSRPEAEESEVIESAKLANAHEFISNLPDGYNTLVGERGMRLSGGERQRISLARAFLRNAPVLILDEPTSSVDMKTESVILEALDRLMKGRTTFMIAHRLSTLEQCDMRLEMERGRLTTAGPTEDQSLTTSIRPRRQEV